MASLTGIGEFEYTTEGKAMINGIEKAAREKIEKTEIWELFPEDKTYFNHLAINLGEVKKIGDKYIANYIILTDTKATGIYKEIEQTKEVKLEFDKN